MKKKKVSQKREITYNIINAGLAGVLVLLGSCASGNLTWAGFGLAVLAAAVVALSKFKQYWDGEVSEYSSRLFTFVK